MCKDCEQLKERNKLLAKEAIQEKTQRILAESKLDIRNMQQRKENEAIRKMKLELAKAKEKNE